MTNDLHESCPPTRPSLRNSHTRTTLTNIRPTLDAKVVVMGSAGVGKTSLVTRYIEERFAPRTTTTTGALFHSKKVAVGGTRVRLQIWDTAGQERFRSMAPMYYRGANAAILVYDITNAASFDDIKIWIDELKRNCDPNLSIYIVGAKADLANRGERAVTPDRARLALHTWFPPPSAPLAHSTITTAPGTPRSEGVYDTYIQPRLAGFAGRRSASFSFGSAVMGAFTTSSTGQTASDKIESDASAGSACSSGGRRRLGHQRLRSCAGRLEDEGYGGEESSTSSEGCNTNGWSPRRGRSAENVVVGDEDEEDESWGLGKGMELWEVSAKDDRGVQNLFNAIIAHIMKHKNAIEEERTARERDSIMLRTDSMLNPSWSRVAEQEEAAIARRGGWNCCAV